MDIDENVINFKTEEWPCYEWFIDIIKKYPMLKISLIYKDITNKKYTGYSIAVDGVIIASEFIYLEREFDHELNYFKYDDFMSYKGDHSYNFLPDSD